MVRIALAGLVALIVVGNPALSAGGEKGKKDVVREIKLERYKPAEGGNVKVPVVIENEKALQNLDATDEVRTQIKKQADLSKEQVLIFAWAGSGQDRLTVGTVTAKDNRTEVVFNYMPGLTRDLRQHLKMFVMPNGSSYKVEVKGR